jgi:hypothetical protein
MRVLSATREGKDWRPLRGVSGFLRDGSKGRIKRYEQKVNFVEQEDICATKPKKRDRVKRD